MTLASIPVFRSLTDLYEPSAIQQLADGRFLVVEDEKQHPFSLLTIAADGSVTCQPLDRGAPDSDTFRKLDDLEGLTLAQSGHVYAITSHSRDGEGGEKKTRNKLVRFRIDGDRVVDAAVVTGLKDHLIAAHPVLDAAARIRDVKADGGLNIEALEITPDQQRLLIGFRSPLVDQRAIIAAVENPAAIFQAGEAPRLAARLETLDLGGHGIRGLAWISAIAGYLVIGGPVTGEEAPFRLWFWSGKPGDPARSVTIPGLRGLEHAEGVCSANIDGQPFIVIVSDDGKREQGRPAHYLLLPPGQLQIAP